MILNFAAADDITCIDIPDGCETKRSQGGKPFLIRVPTPFDYVLFRQGLGVTLDCKTIDARSFPYSSIDQRQLAQLIRAGSNSYRSGYLIWYRALDMVAFHPASALRLCQRGCSLTPAQGMDLGSSRRIYLDRLFHPEPLTPTPQLPTK